MFQHLTPDQMAGAAAISASNAAIPAIAASKQFGFYAGIITMAVFLITALLYLLLRDNPQFCWLHIAPVTILPYWTMTASRSDLGENYRLASTLWLIASGIAAAFVGFSICKYGIQTPRLQRPRLSIQWTLLAFFFVAVAFAVARPPISEEISVQITLPGLGFLVTVAIAFCVRSGVYGSTTNDVRGVARKVF